MPKCFISTVRDYRSGTFWSVGDSDRHFYDQNVMCMRSGLVIKTAPIVRTSLSSRFQSDCETRGPRDLAGVGLRLQQLQPASPAPHQSVAETGGDSNEATAGQSAASGGWMSKAGAGRSSGMTRPRSLDFLSIVTRFQLARRARAVQLGTNAVDNLHDEDWMYNALELDFVPDNNSRHVRLGGSASEARSPPAVTPTDRRVLRRRRRRSQFATAAAAALQAAVNRAAAAAARPRFCASARGVPPTLPPVAPLVIKPEQDSEQSPGERAGETDDVDQLAIMCDRRTERGRQLTSSAPGLRPYERQPVSVTPTHGGSSLVMHGGVTGAVGAFVDMFSRQNYICLQPYLPGTDVRAAMGVGDPSMAATGSLTDLFGRVAAVPESRDAAGAGPIVSTPPPLSSPVSSISVVVSKMGSVTPTQPVTMFRIVGGPGVSGSQPHHIMAYRHRPAHPDQQPVLLSASAVRPASYTPGLVVRQRSPFAGDPSMFGHQMLSVRGSSPAVDQPRVSATASYGDVDAGRIEAEAHELTHDTSGREIHRCRLCARIFTIMSAFRSHVLTTHCRPKNQCAVCGKHFSRSWLLKGHMRTHTGERPYRCPHVGCDRAFADKSNLRSHLLIHNANGKHYVCTRCNRAFAQKRYLHKHRLEVCKI